MIEQEVLDRYDLSDISDKTEFNTEIWEWKVLLEGENTKADCSDIKVLKTGDNLWLAEFRFAIIYVDNIYYVAVDDNFPTYDLLGKECENYINKFILDINVKNERARRN